jgi:hypothetical protein
MKILFRFLFSLSFILLLSFSSCSTSSSLKLFDGETFTGWEGDTDKMWQIIDGAIVGGSLSEWIPHNDFLTTTDSYSDFILKLKFKLEGSEGFVNAGVQFRSVRHTDPANEMIGYQADIGENIYGALYDESRRNSFLGEFDSLASANIVKLNDWNDYEVRAEGKRIQIYLNGKQTIDYYEENPGIPQSGLIGLQIHGGAKALVSYKDISIKIIQ